MKFYIVDASAMFFRAFYAIRPLTSKSGVPTNAIYGYLSMMVKLLKEIRPDYLAVCYDLPGPTFRKDLSPEYKANRSETPEDLQAQLPYMKTLTELLGLPGFELEKYEADDIIGSLAKFGSEQGLKVSIVSGDKDFAQLIGPDVELYDTMKNVRYNEEGVFEKWGVRPEQFIDYLAMVGDSSDNVAGVPGIGPKGAQKLLAEYDTLDAIYENVEGIKGAAQKKLLAGKESAYLSKELVTIVRDLNIVESKEQLVRQPAKTGPLRELLQELSISTFEKNLLGAVETEGSAAETSSEPGKTEVFYEQRKFEELEITPDNIAEVFAEKSEVHFLSSDTGLYMADEKKVARLTGEILDYRDVLERVTYRWVGYDLKAIWQKFQMANPIAEWDHMLAAYVLEPKDPKGFSEVIASSEVQKLPELASGSQMASASFALREFYQNELQGVSGEGVFRGLEMPLIPILYKMERRGFKIDTDLLAGQSQELASDIGGLEKEIHSLADEEFNISSPKQLATILFEKLKLPPKKKTKTGFSTDNEVLQKLASSHPICEKVLLYRELSKLKSTYVDALPTMIDEQGRVHTHMRQAFTATGRLSSNQPNLQNIPIRTERGAQVRKAFIASEGMQLLSIDYSQIELRVLAHFAGDSGLQSAFERDLDIHTATASEIYSVDFESVTSEQRRHAKAVNFGIAYGQGPFGLAESLGISRTEAKEIIARYFEKFPGVKTYMESIVEDAKSTGFVETLFGRRRYLPELTSKNAMMKKFGERAAINAPIQGTAADLVKKAMIDVGKFNDLHMILQVHDELLFEAPGDVLETRLGDLCHTMETVTDLSVPLKVNAFIGPNWEEAH